MIPAAGSATGSYTNATINTIAGTGDAGYSGDGGLATAAELFNPTGVAVDASGNNLFIADSASNRVRWVNLQNNMIDLVAGNGTAGYVGVTGASTAGELDDPEGVAVDAQGDIFIADSGNAMIREVTPAQGGPLRTPPSRRSRAAAQIPLSPLPSRPPRRSLASAPSAWRWMVPVTSSSPTPAIP